MTNGTVLLPIAGRSSRFPGTRPKWLLTAPSGELMLERALRSIPDYANHRIVVGALREHLRNAGGAEAIERALGDIVEIVEFEDVTAGPAATVAEMIKRASVTGPIFIKDCDSWFSPPAIVFDNNISIVDLRDFPNTRNIPGKSFVILNDNLVVEEIREKYICSPYISVGGYGFAQASEYLSFFERLALDQSDAEPFISHVILEAIHAGSVFRGSPVASYFDVGTLEAWNEFRENANLYLMDIDGVILKNAGQYTAPLWDDDDVPLQDNVDTLKALIAKGAQIVFITSRPEKYRAKTEAALKACGLSWHAAVFGVSHSRRILVNDFAPSNPYPSAVAVNLIRNGNDLKKYLK
ncbi:NTP transferase domain-containing protein [Xaviernesmea oryzae]|nr:NTP transferase domain-containing protein [Xaviernesmea oryzae]SEM25355.1 MobA-like NTP transferase domain-containing protein [Xaviernesmea oryzae]